MEQLELILSLCGTILGLLIATLTFLKKFITNAKAKKVAEEVIELSDALLPYIEQAEAHLKYSGADKKEFVMAMASQYASQQGIEFDSKQVSEKIDELISLTKHVNVNSQPVPVAEEQPAPIRPRTARRTKKKEEAE